MTKSLKLYLKRSKALSLPDPTTGVLRTICVNDEWLTFLQGQLHHLRWRGKYWDGDEQPVRDNHENVEKLMRILGGDPNRLCGDSAPYTSTCRRIFPSSPRITWNPASPFNPSASPDGYYGNPWKVGEVQLLPDEIVDMLINLANIDELEGMLNGIATQDGLKDDVFVNFQNLVDWSNPWNLDFLLQLPGLINSGLPRFSFTVQGKAEIFFAFIQVPFGGQVIITRDGDLNPAHVKLFSLRSLSIADLIPQLEDSIIPFLNLFSWAGTGINWLQFLVGGRVKETIMRYVIDEPGTHTVTVTFLPSVGGLSSIGIGGGLRFINICETIPQEDANMGIENIRLNGCNVEALIDGAWVNKFSLLEGLNLTAQTLAPGAAATVTADECTIDFGIPAGVDGQDGLPGVPGADGAQGIQGPQGATGPIISQFPYSPDAPNRRCPIAIGLVNWLWGKYEDFYTEANATVDFIGALDNITLLFPPAYIVVDQVTDAIIEAKNLGISLIQASMSNAKRESIQEWLYCNLPVDGLITEGIWDDFKEESEAIISDNPQKIAWRKFLDSLSFEGISDRAGKESYGDGNCAIFECPDDEIPDCTPGNWSETNDTTNWGDWVIYSFNNEIIGQVNGNGEFESWCIANYNGATQTINQLILEHPGRQNIESVIIEWEYSDPSRHITYQSSVDYWALKCLGQSTVMPIDRAGQGKHTIKVNFPVAPTSANAIYLNLMVFSRGTINQCDIADYVRISKITLCGSTS